MLTLLDSFRLVFWHLFILNAYCSRNEIEKNITDKLNVYEFLSVRLLLNDFSFWILFFF